MLNLSDYPLGFEQDDRLRSSFMREVTLGLINRPSSRERAPPTRVPPRTLVRYWHDPEHLPEDVRACLDSWEPLRDEGFRFETFDDASATAYVAERYGDRERLAFSRCRHPAMRSDYLRMCFVLAEGGFYVDADDVLIGGGWRQLLLDDKLKLQPLCYDVPSGGMIPTAEIWRVDLRTTGRIFYVNNNPIVAPAAHPVLARALARATDKLLGEDSRPDIQSTTGPGNLTAVLAAHAHQLARAGLDRDYVLLRDWDEIAETRWYLSYRNDARNWRNMDVS